MKHAAHPFFFSILLSFALAGCGGGMHSSVDIPFSSGLSQIDATDLASPAPLFRLNGNLAKNGNLVSGIMHITMPACFSFSTDIPVTGTLINAMDFPVILNMTLPSGQALVFNLSHPGGHLSELDGTYAITGAGCAAPPQGGAVVKSLNLTGTWRGTFTSSSGTVAQMSLALTQTGPDAHGFFSGTGTATITGGTCFSAATVDTGTFLIGSGSTLILDGPSGPAGKTTLQGDFAPLPFGGETFNGTYTSTQGACSDSGTVSMQSP